MAIIAAIIIKVLIIIAITVITALLALLIAVITLPLKLAPVKSFLANPPPAFPGVPKSIRNINKPIYAITKPNNDIFGIFTTFRPETCNFNR